MCSAQIGDDVGGVMGCLTRRLEVAIEVAVVFDSCLLRRDECEVFADFLEVASEFCGASNRDLLRFVVVLPDVDVDARGHPPRPPRSVASLSSSSSSSNSSCSDRRELSTV